MYLQTIWCCLLAKLETRMADICANYLVLIFNKLEMT